jgi:hypothetical protein
MITRNLNTLIITISEFEQEDFSHIYNRTKAYSMPYLFPPPSSNQETPTTTTTTATTTVVPIATTTIDPQTTNEVNPSEKKLNNSTSKGKGKKNSPVSPSYVGI